MKFELKLIPVTFTAFAFMAIAGSAPSYALTAKECSTKYNAAKTAGTLGTTTWNEFRKTQCAETTPAAAAPAAETAKPVVKPSTTTAGSAVFPKSIDAKYAKESAGKARMHTCRDQYHANKASNGNGGMKWIQKGGGYYSLCNKALKS